jgi:hypothetical protein
MLHCAPGRSAITRRAAWRRIRQRRVMKSLRTLTSLALGVLLSVQAAVPPDPSNSTLICMLSAVLSLWRVAAIEPAIVFRA